jgi:hypothetical protein
MPASTCSADEACCSSKDCTKLEQESARADQDDGLPQAVFESAKEPHPDRLRPKVQFLDCPEIERALANEPRVSAILQELAEHYNVPQAMVTWRDAGRLCLKAHSSEGVIRTAQIRDSTVFNHTIARELPIIITDLESNSPSTRSLALPPGVERPRFYASSPLVLEKRSYIGTLCFVDCSCARPGFLLNDAEFLVKKAREMGAVLEGWLPRAKRLAPGA